MIKLRNICLRLSSLGLAACLILALFLPVSAASIDFWDLNPVLSNQGENTLINVSIPVDYCYSYAYIDISGEIHELRRASSISFSSDSPYFAAISFYPFGYPWTNRDTLSLLDIPSGTNFSFVFNFDIYPAFSNVDFVGRIRYYSENGTHLGGQTNTITVSTGGNFVFDFVINKPANAVGCTFEWYTEIESGISLFSYELLSTNLTMTLDSVLVQQQQTGRTNAILQKVEQQLADQGQTLDDVLKEQQDTNDKLDDIINGTVEPSSPAGSGAVDDLIDQEDQLIQDMNPGFDAMDDLQADVLEQILGYSQSLSAVSWLLNQFIGIPFIYIILAVSLSLGLTGTILGLFNTVASRYRSEARYRDRRKGG